MLKETLMERYPFVNLCFVLVVITVLALQHSAAVFGTGAHGGALNYRDWLRTSAFDGAPSNGLRAPAELSRAADFLHNAWLRGIVVREWLMEYNTSEWELFNASSPAETDLLEARFHLSNAEAFTEALNERNRALKELAQAETSLQAVESLVGPHLAPQLKTIDEEIAAAETSEKVASSSAALPFETIKADLDHLIKIVRSSKT
jgi:hypothetical protein